MIVESKIQTMFRLTVPRIKEIFGYVCPYFVYGRRLGRDLCRAKGPEDHEKTPSEGLLHREDIDRVRFLSRDHNRSLLVTAETKNITRL